MIVEISNNSNPYLYELIDTTGKTLMASSNKNALNRFDISDLQSGYYIIKATNLNDKQTITMNFVKE